MGPLVCASQTGHAGLRGPLGQASLQVTSYRKKHPIQIWSRQDLLTRRKLTEVVILGSMRHVV